MKPTRPSGRLIKEDWNGTELPPLPTEPPPRMIHDTWDSKNIWIYPWIATGMFAAIIIFIIISVVNGL